MNAHQNTADKGPGKYVGRIEQFEDAAHVVLPDELIGGFARIEPAGSWIPPLFQGVTEDCTVFVETGDNDRVSGEVIEYDQSTTRQKIRAYFIIDTGHQFYRISVDRAGNTDEWGDDYEIEKAVSGKEAKDVDAVIEFHPSDNGGQMWAPEGRVTGVAVMESVSSSD